jgi:hypothetical protein
MLPATFGRYGLSGAGHVGHALRELVRLGSGAESGLCLLDYFNPAFLFLTGGVSLTTSTSRVGVFLLPIVPFAIYGTYLALTDRQQPAHSALLLGGLVSFPLAATLSGERYMIQRAMFVVPFVVLLATQGIGPLVRHPLRRTRVVALLLLLAMPIQFAVFYHDYFTWYRKRSAAFFDPADFRDVTSAPHRRRFVGSCARDLSEPHAGRRRRFAGGST